MTKDILDILYTPIEVPPIPVFDRLKLNEWCLKNYNRPITRREDGKEITPSYAYPWNIVYARNHYSWIDQFNIQFPGLAEYFYSAFCLEEKEINSIVLLPVKHDYTGATFWHADPDEIGLRLYLENNEIDKDYLLIKPTVTKFHTRNDLGLVPTDGIDPKIQNVVHSAKILKSTQGFYINNVRAVHAVNVEQPNLNRLAVLIISRMNVKYFPVKAKELIIKSAEQFSDIAIHWTPPTS
jgi:hypothetical protein